MFGLTEEQLQQIKAAASGTTTPTTTTQTSSSSSNDLFSKIGTPTWNYAYNDNRAASITGQDGKEYFFVPQSYVQKGLVVGNFQEYNKQFLDPSTFQNAVAFELPQGLQSRLENKGFVWSADDFNKLGLNSFSGYNIDENNPAIVGIGTPHPSMQVGSPTSYITQPKLAPGGERVQQDWITPEGRFGGLGQYSYYRYQGPLADFARGALQSIGPLAPLLLEYAAPGIGLGSAYVAGNAAGKLATGQPGAAETLATSAILSQLGVGSGVTEATGSSLAGQVAQGTAGGLLAGKTPEQAVTGAVKGVAIDNLAPAIPTDTTAFDTTQDISDTSGFNVQEPSTPITPIPTNQITGNTGGNMAAYDTEMNAPATQLEDTTPYNFSPEEQQMIYQLSQEAGGTQSVKDAYDSLSLAAKQTAQQSGLKVGDVLNFFKSNPAFTKSIIGTGISAAGGLLSNQANVDAARISAQAIRDAAAQAAEAQRFRPVGITTRFGQSQFEFDPTTGQLKSAGYAVTPELKAMQDRIMALSGQGLTQAEQAAGRYAPLQTAAQGLFSLGQGYLAKTPEEAAADYMARQQALLQPSRDVESARLATQLQRTGRTGLAVSQGGLLGAANPEQQALANARAMQDLQLAAQAQQAGQQQVQFGTGLLGSGANLLGSYTQGLTGAYSPFTTGIGIGSQLESLGQAPLDIGAQLGGRSAQAGANVGQSLFQGGLLGAKTTQAASGFSPFGTALTGLANSPEAQQVLAQWLSGSGYGTNTRQLDTNANF